MPGDNQLLEEGHVVNGKWEILDLIAKGGKGEVYLAKQINLNRQVALKVMSKDFLDSLKGREEEYQSELQRFRREVQVMARIRHPNVLQVYDFDQVQVNGNSLDHTFVQDLVADGTLSQEEADRHPMRNVLDQCVGCGSLKVESGRFKVMAGDRLLLCSDGLIKHVSDDSIKTVLAEGTARHAVEELLDQALHAGGKDNVTIVIMDIPS